MKKTGYNLTKEETAQAYNKIVDEITMPEYFYPKVLEFCSDLNGKRALDVGCGNGSLLNLISRKYKAELYGIELSDKLIEQARKQLGYKGVIKKADATKLPFPNKFFDLVIVTEVLEHLQDPEKCLGEIKRVLKEDGKMILTMPNMSGYFPFYLLAPITPFKKLKKRFLPMEHPLKTLQPIDTCYSYNEIIKLIRGSGFYIKKIKGEEYLPYLNGLACQRLIKFIQSFANKVFTKLRFYRFAYRLFFSCTISRDKICSQR